MEFHEGDVVSGRGIRIGRYQGQEVIDSNSYHKVFDINTNATCFIPLAKMDDLRKLPTKQTVKKNLKMFESSTVIDEGEVDGSRYKYFKAKLEQVNFKKTMEVLHDLSALKFNKEINSSERKLLNELKEKMVSEMAFILECENDELEATVDLKPLKQ